MCAVKPFTPNARIPLGVLATEKRVLVALLTDRSVACADKITAMSSSKGLECFSSVVGLGVLSARI